MARKSPNKDLKEICTKELSNFMKKYGVTSKQAASLLGVRMAAISTQKRGYYRWMPPEKILYLKKQYLQLIKSHITSLENDIKLMENFVNKAKDIVDN